MDEYEKEFNLRKEKIESFKQDLKSVLEKHKIGIYESDNYDGEENYCGSTAYFTVDGQWWLNESIPEILNSIGLSF